MSLGLLFGVLWLLVLPFAQSRLTTGHWASDYRSLFTHAWHNKLMLAEAALFTGLFWLLLFLWQMLFHLLKIDFFRELFEEPIFIYPVTALTFGCAIHLIGSITQLTSVVLEQLLNVLKWLATIAAAILTLFTVALVLNLPGLLFTGQKAIDATWLLWLVAVMVLLLNAAYRDGTVVQPYPKWVARGLRAVVPLMVIIALTALYALIARSRHYGLTVERVWAFVMASAALLYSAGHSIAAFRKGVWLAAIARVNVIVAVVLIVTISAALTPLLSPFRLLRSNGLLPLGVVYDRSPCVAQCLHEVSMMRVSPGCVLMSVCLASTGVLAQSVPPAIFTDPPADSAHPAAMAVLHIPSHGALINGLVYSPPGAGPHPTLVICHGLPGNEKNLDLAQAVRRAGWNAVTFNYRGSWGGPGAFRFAQNLQDADAVLSYLRNPANALKLGIDPTRIAIAGHSMGGWVVAHTAAHDHALIGAILISMADMGLIGSRPHAQAVASMAEDMETLSNVTAESMVNELKAHAQEFLVAGTAQGLARIPVLALTANDHLAAQTDALVAAIKAKGGTRVTAMHVDTDHSWSDHRIALESTVITWLAGLN